jgi:uncharacterized protein (DUF305 family)
MNNKSLIRFTLAVVTSSIPIGLSIANPIEAQMRNNGSDLHHPQNSPKPNPGRMGSGMGMMGMMNADLEALKNAPDFDKAFIEQMIPHHKMAVMMAGMILDSDRPELRELAKSIVPTQSDEIEQMRQWQQTWYRSTSSQS